MRTSRRAALIVGLVAMVVYLLTLAPGLTWAHQGADGGDLASAVAVGGIPHPPGYPTYVLLGRMFALLPLRDVAFRLNLMSAACAATTIVLLYMLLVLTLTPRRNTHTPARWDAIETLAPVCAALAFAFSPVFWSQALITEVYALNALFVAATLLLAQSGRTRLTWLVFGLGLGNHLSLLLVAPALLLLLTRPRAGGDQQRRVGEWAASLLCLPARPLCLLLPSLRAPQPIRW